MTVRAVQGLVRSSRRVSWRLLGSTGVGPLARSLSHAIAGAPPWSPLRLMGPVRSRLKGEVTARRLLEVVRALDTSGVTYWIAGGWGVDALVGRQTRRHDDLDVVLDDFHTCAPTVCQRLSALGFSLTERHFQPVWMPDQWVLEDANGARIDVLSLDRHLVTSAGHGILGEADLFAQGRVGEHSVPCLSLLTQRVVHSGFPPRSVHRRDLELLA